MFTIDTTKFGANAPKIAALRDEIAQLDQGIARAQAHVAESDEAAEGLRILAAMRATHLSDAYLRSVPPDTKQIDAEIAKAQKTSVAVRDQGEAARGAIGVLQDKRSALVAALSALEAQAVVDDITELRDQARAEIVAAVDEYEVLRVKLQSLLATASAATSIAEAASRRLTGNAGSDGMVLRNIIVHLRLAAIHAGHWESLDIDWLTREEQRAATAAAFNAALSAGVQLNGPTLLPRTVARPPAVTHADSRAVGGVAMGLVSSEVR